MLFLTKPGQTFVLLISDFLEPMDSPPSNTSLPYKSSIQFCMFTMYDDDEKYSRVNKNGAKGYLLKDEPPNKIVLCIRELHEVAANESQYSSQNINLFSTGSSSD